MEAASLLRKVAGPRIETLAHDHCQAVFWQASAEVAALMLGYSIELLLWKVELEDRHERTCLHQRVEAEL